MSLAVTVPPSGRTTSDGSSRRWSPLHKVPVVGAVALVVALGLMLGLALALGADDDKSSTPATATSVPAATAEARAELTAYESAITPIVQEGGQIVQQGMKPALDDLLHRHVVPPSYIAIEARSWIATLRDVRSRLEGVTPPASLTRSAGLFLAAIDGYIRAARQFRAAALADAKPVRRHLVDRGISIAEVADRTYDRGSGLLQDLRHQLGLPTSINFPAG